MSRCNIMWMPTNSVIMKVVLLTSTSGMRDWQTRLIFPKLNNEISGKIHEAIIFRQQAMQGRDLWKWKEGRCELQVLPLMAWKEFPGCLQEGKSQTEPGGCPELRRQKSHLEESQVAGTHRGEHQGNRKDCLENWITAYLRLPSNLWLKTHQQNFMKKVSRQGRRNRLRRAGRTILSSHKTK